MVDQYEIILPPFRRGFHIITDQILKNVDMFPEKGIMHIFIKHTSAALTINENADPSVTVDLENFMNHLIPDG
ncbi:MAG: hypothetical protein C0597_08635, partial [Marinilabiliales bacterium]